MVCLACVLAPPSCNDMSKHAEAETLARAIGALEPLQLAQQPTRLPVRQGETFGAKCPRAVGQGIASRRLTTALARLPMLQSLALAPPFGLCLLTLDLACLLSATGLVRLCLRDPLITHGLAELRGARALTRLEFRGPRLASWSNCLKMLRAKSHGDCHHLREVVQLTQLRALAFRGACARLPPLGGLTRLEQLVLEPPAAVRSQRTCVAKGSGEGRRGAPARAASAADGPAPRPEAQRWR